MSAPYQAVILAAGRGSRISEQTDTRPKAILPIGPRSAEDPTSTSFLRRQCEVLQQFGVQNIVVVVGYMSDQVQQEINQWGPTIHVVANTTPDISVSGSLHSMQFAARSEFGILDGEHQTLMMDADIVYHRNALAMLLEAPERNMSLVCSHYRADAEEVLVYGSVDQPRWMGKALGPDLVGQLPCIGEATGIVKFAPKEHNLVRAAMDWMIGNPAAEPGSAEYKGHGPGRRATEHEELSQRMMLLGRMSCVVFDKSIPFMEVDTPEEYRYLRESFYPDLLKLETQETRR